MAVSLVSFGASSQLSFAMLPSLRRLQRWKAWRQLLEVNTTGSANSLLLLARKVSGTKRVHSPSRVLTHSSPVLSYASGWMSTLGWLASVASSTYVVTTQIEAMIQVTQPDYAFARWQATLIMIAFTIITIFFNTWGAPVLPSLEIACLVGHLLGFFVILIPLWVCVHSDPRGYPAKTSRRCCARRMTRMKSSSTSKITAAGTVSAQPTSSHRSMSCTVILAQTLSSTSPKKSRMLLGSSQGPCGGLMLEM